MDPNEPFKKTQEKIGARSGIFVMDEYDRSYDPTEDRTGSRKKGGRTKWPVKKKL